MQVLDCFKVYNYVLVKCFTGLDGLVVSASPLKSKVMGSDLWGHTKNHQKNGTNSLPAEQACIKVGVWQCSPTMYMAR